MYTSLYMPKYEIDFFHFVFKIRVKNYCFTNKTVPVIKFL